MRERARQKLRWVVRAILAVDPDWDAADGEMVLVAHVVNAALMSFRPAMKGTITESRLQRRLIDTLYVDAMVLADEARAYFDEGGRADREALDPMARVGFSCESLKVTTRLMHIIAWLLTQRAVDAGEMAPREALDPSRRLGPAPVSEAQAVLALPDQAIALVEASVELYRRVARLDEAQATEMAAPSPARSMLDRLAMAF